MVSTTEQERIVQICGKDVVIHGNYADRIAASLGGIDERRRVASAMRRALSDSDTPLTEQDARIFHDDRQAVQNYYVRVAYETRAVEWELLWILGYSQEIKLPYWSDQEPIGTLELVSNQEPA